MVRFAFFVDGSNLFGSLKAMGVEVEDYQSFFNYLYKAAEQTWRSSVNAGHGPDTLLQRVYWYQVGSIDHWNLSDAQAQGHLRERFDENKQIKAGYMAAAGKTLAGQPQEAVALKAWSLCFNELKGWYEGKQKALEGMKRFYHAVRTSTDLIDILEAGHWKVDFFSHSCEEKGLDTRLAVDMIALEGSYDVAVVVSGDADSIPSINLMKRRAKHVGAVEFVKGYPPDKKGKGFSSKIKLSADFVVRIYEMELVSKKIATKT
ncbi:MAG: NYN domain-containing protein [Terriglobales bacterium]